MKFIFLSLSLLLSLFAKEPKLELGAGVASLFYPHYIGSKSTNFLTLPFPHIRYRGDYLTIDEDGIKEKIFGVDGLRLDLSMSGSLPASSEKGGVKEGMPDLDLTGEIGLQLIYNFFKKDIFKLELELPLRTVLATDYTSIEYVGLVSNPQLKYSLYYTNFEWTLRTSLLFNDANYNNYYYGVKKIYETPQRSYYDSKGGFSGFKTRVGMTYQKDNWWVGAFFSYYNISNAVFSDSPLVETDSAFYTGASVAYIFYTED